MLSLFPTRILSESLCLMTFRKALRGGFFHRNRGQRSFWLVVHSGSSTDFPRNLKHAVQCLCASSSKEQPPDDASCHLSWSAGELLRTATAFYYGYADILTKGWQVQQQHQTTAKRDGKYLQIPSFCILSLPLAFLAS